jgi:recombination protein RecT
MSNDLQLVVNDIYSVKEQFERVNVSKQINFEREAGFAIQVLQGNTYAIGIARSNRQSVIDAVTNVAAIGISLNPATKQAYLVPRDGKICLDISYMGLIDLAVESGAVAWAKAAVVCEQDTFELDGYDRAPRHLFSPFAKNRGEIVGVYVVVKTTTGDYLTDTMTTDEINLIRDRSSAWKAWVSKKKSCPWVTDWSEMAKKTVVKRAAKYWPRGSGRLEQAIHYLNTDGNEGLQEIKEDRHTPKEVDGYQEFEDLWLPKLQEAAFEGMSAYRVVVGEIPNGEHKDRLASLHHKRLRECAMAADRNPKGAPA